MRNYSCASEPPLNVPIVACGGLLDPRATYDDIDAWRGFTRAAFALRVFAGDHFFLQSHRDELIGYITEHLGAIGPEPASSLADFDDCAAPRGQRSPRLECRSQGECGEDLPGWNACSPPMSASARHASISNGTANAL